ncbi:MAG TPA: DUF1707 domain-containing protein [Gemmatimonadaceae bacterium]|nr:DUF1707 domain-containing protein [Gemmatimonadaceae bacterium]
MTTTQPLDAARTRVVDLLSSYFAHDGIVVEELDRRLDAAYKATSILELEALVRDLPHGPAALARVSMEVPAWREEASVQLGHAEESERLLAIMSETRRRGLWVVPKQLDVVSVMAETELDLRQASLAPGLTEISLSGLMTKVTIIVPAGVRVLNRTLAIMSAVRDHTANDTAYDPMAPVLRIEGWAVMAEVVIRKA